MSVNLQRMRLCFKVAVAWGNWSAEEQAEYSAAIRTAVEGNDVEALAWWAQYLEAESGLEYLARRCREIEASVRAERRQAA